MKQICALLQWLEARDEAASAELQMLQRSACAQRSHVPQHDDACEFEGAQFCALHQRAQVLEGAGTQIQELQLAAARERAQVPDKQATQLEMLQGMQC